jgi:hypothetical protein
MVAPFVAPFAHLTSSPVFRSQARLGTVVNRCLAYVQRNGSRSIMSNLAPAKCGIDLNMYSVLLLFADDSTELAALSVYHRVVAHYSP